jgi:CHAD domain-containing protein
MKSKGSSTKRAPLPKRKPVLVMPTTRAIEADNHAERIAEHRRQLDEIHYAYQRSTAEVFSDPVSLAKRKSHIRTNMRQLSKALGDWHCAALELLQEGQQAALLQMLDFKGCRWLN